MFSNASNFTINGGTFNIYLGGRVDSFCASQHAYPNYLPNIHFTEFGEVSIAGECETSPHALTTPDAVLLFRALCDLESAFGPSPYIESMRRRIEDQPNGTAPEMIAEMDDDSEAESQMQAVCVLCHCEMSVVDGDCSDSEDTDSEWDPQG
ncbi:hypothetical protein K438DRAFT_1981772 [Mycena galopus ATCC 62051]|nr:hypothetical protein K438DRAFT_1981772 [Mycena galopus ATCC 62051]